MHPILGSACFRILQFLQWYMDICCWSGFDQILVTQCTSYNINYWWRFFWRLLTERSPNSDDFCVPSKSEKDGLLSMHTLEIIRCWSKYPWTESLKKFKIPIFDSTLLRSVYEFDRGQPTEELAREIREFRYGHTVVQ